MRPVAHNRRPGHVRYLPKFDRDLLRQRAWDYSATAFGCDPSDYEALRQAIIDNYGAAYELLAPPEEKGRKQRKRRRR